MAKRIDNQDICQGGMGHKWGDPIDYDYRPDAYYEYWLTKPCERCSKLAILIFDPSGDHVRTKYVDPPGWKKHNIVRKIDVARHLGANRQKPTEKKPPAKRRAKVASPSRRTVGRAKARR